MRYTGGCRKCSYWFCPEKCIYVCVKCLSRTFRTSGWGEKCFSLATVYAGLLFQMGEVVLRHAGELAILPWESETLFWRTIASSTFCNTLYFSWGNNHYEYFIGCWKREASSWCGFIISSFLEMRPREVKEVTLGLTVSYRVWLRAELRCPFWCPIITWEWSQEDVFQTLEPNASAPPFPFCSLLTCALFGHGPDRTGLPGCPRLLREH